MNTTTDLSSERLDELIDRLEYDMFQGEQISPPYGGLPPLTRDELLALVAQARRTEQLERERDALRALVVEWAADRLLPDGYCSECGETGPMINEMGHSGLCFVERALRILAQSTTEGGE